MRQSDATDAHHPADQGNRPRRRQPPEPPTQHKTINMKFLLTVVCLATTASAFAPISSIRQRTTSLNIATAIPDVDVLPKATQTQTKGPLINLDGIAFSGLKGQALGLVNEDFPDRNTVSKVIPADCYETDTAKSLGYLAVSVLGTAACTAVGVNALSVLDPAQLWTLPFWLGYDVITGTVAMGLWVLAHECGHGAFSSNKQLQDAVGYIIHSIMLTPYYSWQRSHAVHHRYTNHMELGETHVPEQSGNAEALYDSIELRDNILKQFGDETGIKVWGGLQAFLHLIVGWPAYLLIGATGGPDRGVTNHFYPYPLSDPRQPKKELFPGNCKEKVYQSDIGCAVVATGALVWAACNGPAEMMALYGGPLIVVNAWLVLYTW